MLAKVFCTWAAESREEVLLFPRKRAPEKGKKIGPFKLKKAVDDPLILLANGCRQSDLKKEIWRIVFRISFVVFVSAIDLPGTDSMKAACARRAQMSFWYTMDPCHLSYTARFDVFVDTFFLVFNPAQSRDCPS